MATINMPPNKKETADDTELHVGQVKPIMRRYRLQIDRQTKTSFDDKGEAEKRGKAIKKEYPIVQVCVYDAETEERTIL